MLNSGTFGSRTLGFRTVLCLPIMCHNMASARGWTIWPDKLCEEVHLFLNVLEKVLITRDVSDLNFQPMR